MIRDEGTLRTRLLHSIRIQHGAGCWIWAKSTKNGYGVIGARRHQRWYAHRVSYELFVGPIPDGHQIDHLCRTPRCINPDHLEAVTRRENVLRGSAPNSITSVTKRCQRGHDLWPQQERMGHRWHQCTECQREANRRSRLRKRAAA